MRILISIILFFVALLIFSIVFPFGILYQFISIFKKRNKSIYFSDYFFKIAQCIDQLGNVTYRELFNDVLITPASKNAFGDNQETISSVIGKNLEDNTLSKTGIWLNKILNLIQPNHSVISIEDNVNYPTDESGL
jgi:hypothetical protein